MAIRAILLVLFVSSSASAQSGWAVVPPPLNAAPLLSGGTAPVVLDWATLVAAQPQPTTSQQCGPTVNTGIYPTCPCACSPGPAGPQGPSGPRGPKGDPGDAGVPWPLTVPGYDFTPGGVTIDVYATVPRQDGRHDKIVYSSALKAAALFTRDASGQRCYQVALGFHPDMLFRGVTVDATRTFSWHDATGWWTESWVERACQPY